mgnify:CR=1 FL=1|jgi:hypothetical protein
MTDDTGLLEHCLGNIPHRREGYTTDDNARALWLCVERMRCATFLPLSAEEETLIRRLTDTYLSFLLWAQKSDGTFHNNFSYDRRPEPEQRSDDCLGRTVWACAVAHTGLPCPDRRFVAGEMLKRSLPRCREMTSPRGWAYALAACCLLLQSGGAGADATGGVDTNDDINVNTNEAGEITALFPADSSIPPSLLRSLAAELEERLIANFAAYAGDGWRWFEPVMSYGNGLLPWALLVAFGVTGNRRALRVAESSLDFLIAVMSAPHGSIRPIGNEGWCTREHRGDWDQQPLEAMKLALACREADRIIGTEKYRNVASRCREWFYGDNDKGCMLANPAQGSCSDALTREGASRNRGAESTLAFLMTELIYGKMNRADDQKNTVPPEGTGNWGANKNMSYNSP